MAGRGGKTADEWLTALYRIRSNENKLWNLGWALHREANPLFPD